MKKLSLLLYVAIAGLLLGVTSCRENSPVGDSFADDYYNPKGSIISSFDVNPGAWEVPLANTTSISFSIDYTAGEEVSGVEVLASFNGGEAVSYATVSSLPATFDVPMTEILDVFGLAVGDIVPDEDQVIFTFASTSGGGVTVSSDAVVVPFINCLSALKGTYEYETSQFWCDTSLPPVTGTVEIIEQNPGVYTFSDWGFGSYEVCYGGSQTDWGTLQITETCGIIATIGEDAFTDTWTITVVEVAGDKLTLKYDNTYGEAATTVLTNPNGDWPALSN